MANFTENYNLIKPGEEDYYDVQDFNDNMDTIDGLFAATEAGMNAVGEKVDAVNSKLGTPAEGQTVFSLLQGSGQGVVKSTQRITYSPTRSTTSASFPITPVDPTKSFVIFERLKSLKDTLVYFDYTLTATSLECTHESPSSDISETVGFWVIEFY